MNDVEQNLEDYLMKYNSYSDKLINNSWLLNVFINY